MTLKIVADSRKTLILAFPRASGSEPEEPTIFHTKTSKENAKKALKIRKNNL